MKKFSLLSLLVVAVSGIVTAFTPDKTNAVAASENQMFSCDTIPNNTCTNRPGDTCLETTGDCPAPAIVG